MKKALLLLSLLFCPLAIAGQQITGNLSVSQNVGIGTTSNSPINASLVVLSGNVGIDSIAPGAALDVIGTVRSTGFTAGTSGITLGGVTNTSWPSSMVYPSAGIALSTGSAWSASISGTSGQFVKGDGSLDSNSYIRSLTPITLAGSNVGIGSSNPGQALDVNGTVQTQGLTSTNASAVNTFAGNVGIGTINPTDKLYVSSSTGGVTINGVSLPQPGCDTNTELLVHPTGLIIDQNCNGSGAASITVGSAAVVTSPYVFSQYPHSINFNLGGGNVMYVSSSLLNPGTGNFAIGSFVYPTSFSNTPMQFSEKGTNNYYEFTTQITGTGGVNLFAGNGTVGGYVNITTSDGAVPLNQWTWIEVKRLGNTWNLCINNSVGATASYSGSLVVQGSKLNWGGYSDGSSTYNLSGYQDEIWVYNGTPSNNSCDMPPIPIGSFSALPTLTLSGNNSALSSIQGDSLNTKATWYYGINPAITVGSNGVPSFPNTTNSALFTGGNVGIGSTVPGQALDVTGTVRAINFIGSSAGLTGLAASPTNAIQYNSGSNTLAGSASLVFNGTNVGIGTSTPQGALVVTNGNVGIGTWAPQSLLTIAGQCKGLAAGDILCSCNSTGGVGYCVTSITGVDCATCTCC